MVGRVAARVSWRPSLSNATARAARSSLSFGGGHRQFRRGGEDSHLDHGNERMNFQPSVGCGYGSNNSLGLPKRLLVLGESHYGAEPRPDITKEVVREVFDEDVPYRYRFFTSIFKAFCRSGREPTREALAEFCCAFAFYNFIQEMIVKPGVRPSQAHWEGDVAPFLECLKMWKPSHVVACGFELWDNLPDKGFSRLAVETERDFFGQLPDQGKRRLDYRRPGNWIGRYEYGGGSCLILRTRHPSVAFSASEWRPVLRSFFQLERD